MLSSRKFLGSAILAGSLAFSITSFAADVTPPPPPTQQIAIGAQVPPPQAVASSEGMQRHFEKRLQLTSDQKKEFGKLWKDASPQLNKDQKEMRDNVDRLRLAYAGKSSILDIQNAFAAVQKAHGQLCQDRFDFLMRVQHVLTPEQREKLFFMMHAPENQGPRGMHPPWPHHRHAEQQNAEAPLKS